MFPPSPGGVEDAPDPGAEKKSPGPFSRPEKQMFESRPPGAKMEAQNHPKKWLGKCLIFGSILEAKMLQNGSQDRPKMGPWAHLGPILGHLGPALGQSWADVGPS